MQIFADMYILISMKSGHEARLEYVQGAWPPHCASLDSLCIYVYNVGMPMKYKTKRAACGCLFFYPKRWCANVLV